MQAAFASLDLAAFTRELAGQFRSIVEKAGLTLDIETIPDSIQARLIQTIGRKSS